MRRLHDILPYEPGYTHHREVERKRRATRAWLQEREAALKPEPKPPTSEPKRS